MSEQSNIYTELWSPQALEIRPCSRLFSLEPIGIGTSTIESLSSYLCRLADEHCVSLQKLVTQEISPLIIDRLGEQDLTSRSISSILGNSDAKPAINGMRDMTRSLVNALGQLTLRQDLRYLSCLTYQGIIKDKSLFRQHKAWCPQCFEQQKQEKQIIYEPLLWSFKDANYCLHHNCQLRDRCPHCDSTQKAIANFSIPGYCNKCRSWLGTHENTSCFSSKSGSQDNYFLVKSIGDFIALAPELSYQFTLKNLKKKLKLILFCFERAIHQDLSQYIVLIKIVEKLKIDLKQNYSKPLNLVELLIPTCQQAKISIPQLFKNDYDNLAQILTQNMETDYQIA